MSDIAESCYADGLRSCRCQFVQQTEHTQLLKQPDSHLSTACTLCIPLMHELYDIIADTQARV